MTGANGGPIGVLLDVDGVLYVGDQPIAGAHEDRDERHPKCCGDVQQSSVDTDDKCGALDLPCHGVEWLQFADVHTCTPGGNALSPLTIGTVAPKQDQIEAVAANGLDELDPVRFRPLLIRPCRRV